MSRLELKRLAPYLPYGLKVEVLDFKIDYVGKKYDEIIGFHQWDKNCKYWSVLTVGGSKPNIERIKPILRPLSDFKKEIEVNEERFVPYKFLVEKYAGDSFIGEWLYLYQRGIISIEVAPYKVLQKLFEWHFDVFGLIEKGLSIDINTLKE